MPIRLMTLLEREEDPTLKDRLARLMDHNKEREQDSRRWEWEDQRVVQPLLKLNSKWSRQDIHRCIGLFRTNACTTQARNQMCIDKLGVPWHLQVFKPFIFETPLSNGCVRRE